ncbi:MAG: UTP--glucose-1-phosphate uridylyltransferase GalU [Acidobacteria bacterium]|nr:UTP--glucose-1-phosphate uridylyltransferase GalU [Acidobacteriota bacterium]
MKRVRKAVIPAAGLGTRFLPATKAIPKEMLPIVDKPTIQYVVEEAVHSQFEDIIFVTSQSKSAIEDHFDYDYQLEKFLKDQNREDLWKMVSEISGMIAISSVRQKKPLGLGHAVLVTEAFVGEEPFGVFLGDDLLDCSTPCMKQLREVFEAYHCTVVAVQEVPKEAVSRYGVVSVDSVADGGEGRLFRVKEMIEKPSPEKAPSNLAIIGRYILTPRIFKSLRETQPGKNGEIQLTDGIRALMQEEPVYAYRFKGARYDAGNKLEYLMATVEFALRHEEIKDDFRAYLKSLKL